MMATGGTGGGSTPTGGTGGGAPTASGGSGGAVAGNDGGVKSDAVVTGPGRDGGGSADATPPVAAAGCASASEIATKILNPKCGICHGANMPAAALDLVTAGSRARILNKPSIACNGKMLATPDGAGHFFDKLLGAIPGCGNQMPFGAVGPLNAVEIQCLRDWVKGP